MPINCSLEIPNSAARSWIRVVATYFPRYRLLAIGYQPTREIWICDANRLHRRLPQSRTQFPRYRPAQHGDSPSVCEPRHLLDRPRAGILRQHHARQLSSL